MPLLPSLFQLYELPFFLRRPFLTFTSFFLWFTEFNIRLFTGSLVSTQVMMSMASLFLESTSSQLFSRGRYFKLNNMITRASLNDCFWILKIERREDIFSWVGNALVSKLLQVSEGYWVLEFALAISQNGDKWFWRHPNSLNLWPEMPWHSYVVPVSWQIWFPLSDSNNSSTSS